MVGSPYGNVFALRLHESRNLNVFRHMPIAASYCTARMSRVSVFTFLIHTYLILIGLRLSNAAVNNTT